MNNNRKIERFKISLPTRIWKKSASSLLDAIDLLSRDVSSNGGFFLTSNPFNVGTTVVVKMLLLSPTIKNHDEKIGQVLVSGKVIRIDDQGMAIHFNQNYSISSVRAACQNKILPLHAIAGDFSTPQENHTCHCIHQGLGNISEERLTTATPPNKKIKLRVNLLSTKANLSLL